ncbi:unnamed protein product, partial [marine sediment metagenome]
MSLLKISVCVLLDWGMKNRLSRIIRPETGRSLILPIDHGYFLGPTRKLEDPWKTVEPLLPYSDALMLTRGILRSSMNPDIDGKSIAQIAKEREADQWDTWLDIIAEDPHARGVTGQLLPKDCYLRYYTHPKGMVGLDTSVFDTKWQAKNPPYSFPGINTFSAFPMFFIKYMRDGDHFTLEEAVEKTSTLAARVHNIKGRGILK